MDCGREDSCGHVNNSTGRQTEKETVDCATEEEVGRVE